MSYTHQASSSWNKNGGNGVIKRLCRIVTANEIQFSFMLAKERSDTVFILRKLHKVMLKEKVVCFVDLVKTVDRVPMEWNGQ